MKAFFLLLLSFSLSFSSEVDNFLDFVKSKDINLGFLLLNSNKNSIFKDDILLKLSKIYYEKKDYKNAIYTLEKANPYEVSNRALYLELWENLGLSKSKIISIYPYMFPYREIISHKYSEKEISNLLMDLVYHYRFKTAINVVNDLRLNSEEAIYWEGRALMGLKEYHRAYSLLSKIKNYKDAGVLAFISALRYSSDEDAKDIERRITNKQELSQINNIWSLIWFYRRDFEKAKTYLLKEKPSFNKYFYLGISNYALQDYEEAFANFYKAFKIGKKPNENTKASYWLYLSCLNIYKNECSSYLRSSNRATNLYSVLIDIIKNKPITINYKSYKKPSKYALNTIKLYKKSFKLLAKKYLFKHVNYLKAQDLEYLRSINIEWAIDVGENRFKDAYFGLTFPIPYLDDVELASNKFGVNKALMYAIMRQESVFDPRSFSSAKARGLMQIIPSAQRMLSRIYNIKTDNIYNPKDNIIYGGALLNYSLSSQSYNVIKGIAAYNAGAFAVRRWSNFQNPALYIELIPYKETRNYVKRVFRNYIIYSIKLSGRLPNQVYAFYPFKKFENIYAQKNEETYNR